MKTTIELPDALATQAKALAHAQGVTLRQLMVDGLRSELERRTGPARAVDFTFTTVGGDGPNPGVDPGEAIELSYGMRR